MSKNVISLQISEYDLHLKKMKQGYVFVKHENGFILKDYPSIRDDYKSQIYDIELTQKNYGKTWALTKEELI